MEIDQKEFELLKTNILDQIGYQHFLKLNTHFNKNLKIIKNTEQFAKYDCSIMGKDVVFEIKTNSYTKPYDELTASDFYHLTCNHTTPYLVVIQTDNTRIYNLQKIKENRLFQYEEVNRDVMGSNPNSGKRNTKMVFFDFSDSRVKDCMTIYHYGTYHSLNGLNLNLIINNIKKCNNLDQLNGYIKEIKNNFLDNQQVIK